MRGGYGIMFTPDENPLEGLKSILKSGSRSRKTDRDPELMEAAHVLYHLMKRSSSIENTTWVTEWGGSGIMYQALRRLSGNKSEFNQHNMFFAAPTTNVKALEELAKENGIEIERNSRYFDGLNLTQMIGSGRLAGGNYGAAWRRLRSGDENSYNVANFGSDVYRETQALAWSTFGHVATSNKVMQLVGAVGGGTTAAVSSPNTMSSIIGLGVAILGVGDAAFQSFLPRTYHKTMEKFN